MALDADDVAARLAEIQAAVEADEYIPQARQRVAHQLLEDGVGELLYGGAKGGGKTRFGLEHVVDQCQRYPGNRWLILRRVWPSLRRTILPRLTQMLAGKATYNANAHEFRFDNTSVIELGSVQFPSDTAAYEGAEFGGIFFEELTEFGFDQFDTLRAIVRAPVAGVKPHIIATTNPVNEGLRWVRRRYIRPDENQPAVPPMIPWRPNISDDDLHPVTRVFIPATLADNPALEARDPGYRRRLESLTDPRLRRAYLEGDWDAMLEIPGALWRWEMITPFRQALPDQLGRLCVGFDPSGTKGRDEHGIVAVGRAGSEYWVVADRSGQYDVDAAAKVAVGLYHDLRADALVVETNFGGDWVPSNIKHVDPSVRVEKVNASRGKAIRARPVITPYTEGRVHHVTEFLELEGELTSWIEGDASPGRLDALVWGLTWLGAAGAPMIDWDVGLDWAMGRMDDEVA